MKKSFLFLAGLVLMGAGCANATTLKTETQTEVKTTSPTDVNTSDSTSATTTETIVDGKTVINSGGIEATITTDTKAETKTSTTQQKAKEENVPVVDVVLGNADVKVTMEAGNYFFNPKTITASAGQKIQILFSKNTGTHNFIIDKLGLNYSIKQGEGVAFTAPKEPGSYPFYCGIGSHRSLGMEGTLIVK